MNFAHRFLKWINLENISSTLRGKIIPHKAAFSLYVKNYSRYQKIVYTKVLQQN